MFNVILKLYFVYFDESQNIFKVYLDDAGLISELKLDKEDQIEDYIFEKTLDIFYGQTQQLLNSCKLSDIEKKEDIIYITYNIYCYDTLECKCGKFVPFDKNSIELYRFAKNRGI